MGRMQHEASVTRYWYTAQLHTVNIYSGGVDEFSQPANKEDDEKGAAEFERSSIVL